MFPGLFMTDSIPYQFIGQLLMTLNRLCSWTDGAASLLWIWDCLDARSSCNLQNPSLPPDGQWKLFGTMGF